MTGLRSQAPGKTVLRGGLAPDTPRRAASPEPVRKVAWPFAFVVDKDGRQTNWVALHAPIVSPGRLELFAGLRRQGFRFVGFTSDGHFPGDCDGRLDYLALCEGWCHCLRDPGRVFPPDTPLAAISLSDFTDPACVSVDRFPRNSQGFDIIHVSAAEGWKREAKNWPLARACLLRLAGDLKLSCLAVGVEEDEALASAGIACVSELPWPDLMGQLASARLLLVASVEDASPRILAESLCLDTPVLVNRAILGGWKYVNAFTGRFFSDVDDVGEATEKCLERRFHSRAWFSANHGPVHAGRELRRLLVALDPALGYHERLDLNARLSATGTH